MAVALEDASVGGGNLAHWGGNADVGHQPGVDTVFALGLFHHVDKGGPIGSRANRNVLVLQRLNVYQVHPLLTHRLEQSFYYRNN